MGADSAGRRAPDQSDDVDAGMPWAGLAEARRRLYAPGAGEPELARVRELEAIRERELERIASRRAVGSAGAAMPPDGSGPPGGPPPSRVPRLLPAALLVAAAVAFAGGLAIGAPRPAARTVASPSAPAPSVTRPPQAGGALAVFAKPQTAEDVPSLVAEGDLVPSSFRLLALLPDRELRLFAARTIGDGVCLVALGGDGHLVASCSSTAEFRVAPRSVDLTAQPVPRSVGAGQVPFTASWRIDGALTAGSVL